MRILGLILGLLLACNLLLAGEAAKKEFPTSSALPDPLTPNTWVKVESHGTARRSAGAIVYLPQEQAFVHCMGGIGAWNDHGPWPYDELTFKLSDRVWENRYPPGKESWGPKVGICKPPQIPGHGFRIKDKEGNPRLGLWEGGFAAYRQWAYDPDRNRFLAYSLNRTIEYDFTSRAWTELKATGNPMDSVSQRLWWATLCYDAHNKEFVLFGGNNGASEYNDTRTWIFSPAKLEWRRLETGSTFIKSAQARATKLRLQSLNLAGACYNRLFATELSAAAGVSLPSTVKPFATALETFKQELTGKGSGYEKVQCERAMAALGEALKLASTLNEAVDANTVRAARELTLAVERAEYALMQEPPPRAYAPMVYDPATKKIVLFGGDRLDMLYADTWVYDCATRTWEERRPEKNPSPRAGHALLRLPKSGAIALLGGYGYASDTGYWGPLYQGLTMQAWSYDVAANKWELIKDWGKHDPAHVSARGGNFTVAVDANDVALCLGSEPLKGFEWSTVSTYACQLDAKTRDQTAEAKLAVAPGTVAWRSGPYDTNWYLEPTAPDEAAFQARLKTLPANTWTQLTHKETRLPRQNRDWGTAVYDPDRQAIYRWSGGHSAHCGTDTPVYSLRTGRYHLKHPPAFPIENIGSCGDQPSRCDFQGRPWIPGHSYHSYAYDPVSKQMVCTGHGQHSFAYNPDNAQWSCKPLPKGMSYSENYYTLTLCATPDGACAWTRFGTIFKYDGLKQEWNELKLNGEKLIAPKCDEASMCYDSKRNRLLLVLSDLKGDLMEVDLKTMAARRLAPKGMSSANGFFWRECVYDTANDLMVVAVGAKDKPWPVYDCAKNAWVSVKVSGSPGFGNSNGLMYDPQRKLVLAVDTNSLIHALKLDPTDAQELK